MPGANDGMQLGIMAKLKLKQQQPELRGSLCMALLATESNQSELDDDNDDDHDYNPSRKHLVQNTFQASFGIGLVSHVVIITYSLETPET